MGPNVPVANAVRSECVWCLRNERKGATQCVYRLCARRKYVLPGLGLTGPDPGKEDWESGQEGLSHPGLVLVSRLASDLFPSVTSYHTRT